MLKVTNKAGSSRSKLNEFVASKRRGRPPKVRPSTLDTMNAQNDPDIRFIQDLTVTDPTAIVQGADPEKHYRWCEESKMRTRQFQGYTKVTDQNVKTNYDGNFMPAEGFDMRRANKGGMILCEIPKSLYQKRQAISLMRWKRSTFQRCVRVAQCWRRMTRLFRSWQTEIKP